MTEEKLPPLSPNSQKSNKGPSDAFVIAQLRGEMMKVQQSIQRLSSDYDQLFALLPDGLAQTLAQYESNSHILDAKVTSETSRNWIDELNSLSLSLENIHKQYSDCNARLKKTKQASVFETNCNNFELQLTEKNKQFLDNLENEITEKINKLRQKLEKEGSEEQLDSEETTKKSQEKMRLSAMIVEVKERQNSENIFVKKHPDPELSLRIKRHTDRIRHIEDLLQYYSSSIKVVQESPIEEIKNLYAQNQQLSQQIEEKFQNIATNKSKPPSTIHSAEGTPIPYFTREELHNAGEELRKLAFDITNKSIQYTKDIQSEAQKLTDDVKNSLSNIRNVAMESEKSAKLSELIEENVELMKQEPFHSGRVHLDENDAKEEAEKSKDQIDKLLADTNKKLENINERLRQSLAKTNPSTSKTTTPNIPVNEPD